MTANSNQGLILKGVAILAVIALLGYVLIKILQRVGVLKDKQSKTEETDTKQLRESDLFNPIKHLQTPHKVLGSGMALEYAKELRSAIRGFGTNEEKIFSIFRQFFNKINISEVSEQYYKKYKSDLKADLFNELRQSEISILKQIIDRLPNF